MAWDHSTRSQAQWFTRCLDTDKSFSFLCMFWCLICAREGGNGLSLPIGTGNGYAHLISPRIQDNVELLDVRAFTRRLAFKFSVA